MAGSLLPSLKSNILFSVSNPGLVLKIHPESRANAYLAFYLYSSAGILDYLLDNV